MTAPSGFCSKGVHAGRHLGLLRTLDLRVSAKQVHRAGPVSARQLHERRQRVGAKDRGDLVVGPIGLRSACGGDPKKGGGPLEIAPEEVAIGEDDPGVPRLRGMDIPYGPSLRVCHLAALDQPEHPGLDIVVPLGFLFGWRIEDICVTQLTSAPIRVRLGAAHVDLPCSRHDRGQSLLRAVLRRERDDERSDGAHLDLEAGIAGEHSPEHALCVAEAPLPERVLAAA
jgi:hypothetical protein